MARDSMKYICKEKFLTNLAFDTKSSLGPKIWYNILS